PVFARRSSDRRDRQRSCPPCGHPVVRRIARPTGSPLRAGRGDVSASLHHTRSPRTPMNPKLILPLSLLVGAACASAVEPLAATGPQVTGSLRIVKSDGATVIAEAPIAPAGTPMKTLKLSASDAFLSLAGKCAFNVKYDEISATAASNTTNRIYSNDA